MAIAIQPFEGSYKVDANHSSFQFSVAHLGLSTFRASFGSVFFTDWLITLNWLGLTATTRATYGATA